jgi:hypothetical protein
MSSLEKANSVNVYVILTVAIIVGTVGVFFRSSLPAYQILY